MNPELTQITQTEQATDGYIFAALLSHDMQQVIGGIQQRLDEAFPGSLWLPTDEQLHVTVAHAISPDAEIDYSRPRPELFADIEASVNEAMSGAVPAALYVPLQFATIEAHPSAIIIKATDGGQFEAIRDSFISHVALPAGTRRPPTIIHATIARYSQELPFDQVKKLVSTIVLDEVEVVREIVLAHETEIFMQQYEILKRFGSSSE